ncbi:MAG: DUF1015 family protein [Myxococcaceae bacterium]
MARVQPFTALRYVSDVEPRLSWTPFAARLTSLGTDPHHHSQALLASAAPSALLQEWASGGVLVEESPGLYVLEVDRIIARAGRPQGPARYLVCVMDEPLDALQSEAPDLTVPAAQVVPAFAADDQGALEELLAGLALGLPRNTFQSENCTLRLWKVSEPETWARIDTVLSEMIVRPLVNVPRGARAMVAMTPVANERADLRPIHRGLARLETFDANRFLSLVKDYARVYDLETPLNAEGGLERARGQLAALATRSHAVLALLPGNVGRILRFRQDLDLFHLKAAPRNPTLRSLDLALLESVVFKTVLGLSKPESPLHPNLFPVAPVAKLVEQVNAGVFQAGFALNPPPRWELRAVMEAAQQLPPKTLELEGAPPAGLLFLAP